MIDAFGIFEGGGAKGLAHVGALKAAEEKKVHFIGVAGASAGAIIAALVAVGYSADEIYDPDNPASSILPVDFLEFFDAKTWRRWVRLQADLRALSGIGPLRVWLKINRYLITHKMLLSLLAERLGLFDKDLIRSWLNALLLQKLGRNDSTQNVTFAEIPVPLKIVTTDVVGKKMHVFGKVETPDAVVADAVCASISIPFFFCPAKSGDHLYVDGGVTSNFPAWVFDEERWSLGPQVPTYGFRLVDINPQAASDTDQCTSTNASFVHYIQMVAQSALFGAHALEHRGVENLHVVNIQVDIGTTEFDTLNNRRHTVYHNGLHSARSFFIRKIGPKDPTEGKVLLKHFAGRMRTALSKVMSVEDSESSLHLRSNILMPVGNGRLRVTYTYNMDTDADDRLTLGRNSGGCAICIKQKDIVFSDLKEAKLTYEDKYHMNKYEQALVRSSLSSLFAIPIFPDDDDWLQETAQRRDPIGVLGFDSDNPLLSASTDPSIVQTCIECARLAAIWLRS